MAEHGTGALTAPAGAAEVAAWVARYADDPVLFVQEVLGADPDPWQVGLLQAYGRRERRVSVRSCHRAGKTTGMSWCALHQLLTRYPQKTVVTAPTAPQLFDALATEMKMWVGRLPRAVAEWVEVKSESIVLRADPSGSFISFRTSRAESPEAMQGVHSEWVLLLVDEASGVPEPVFEASIGSMAGERATTILASNATRTNGFFFDTHHKLADMWVRFHVSADVPEAAPGAWRTSRVTPDFVADVERRYDGRDSNAFRVRVLGEFPRTDLDAQIPYELVEAARHRDVKESPVAAVVWGVDVARFGDDLSALAKRRGNVLLEPVRVKAGLDTMQVAGWIWDEYQQAPVPARPREILVDVIGIGAGVVDRLRELGLPVQGVNVAESPSLRQDYPNLRSQLWDEAKDWFAARDCRIPDDEALVSELTRVRYRFLSTGKKQTESKDEMRKQKRGSPDRADAFVLTFAGHAGTLTHGWSPHSPWQQPIKRNLPGQY